MLFPTPPLDSSEKRAIERIDALWNDLRYQLGQPRRWYGPLRRVVAARNVQGSNSIEGHHVSVDDAAALLAGDEVIEAGAEDADALRNYGDAMTYVLQLADDPTFEYSGGLLKSLHYSMMKHDLSSNPGRYRTGAVRVVSSADHEGVYEGPDADEVPSLVNELTRQLSAEEAGGGSPWVPAAMAHLNLVMIHPFKDGNGRMARTAQTLVLVRAKIQSDTFLSIEEYLGANTSTYYSVLAEVGKGSWNPTNDARPWVRFALKAQFTQAKTIERRIAEASRLWEAIDESRDSAGLHERTMDALYFAALGLRVRRSVYLTFAADISERVATADLKRLADTGWLVPVGERRGRYYVASERLKTLRERTREPRKPTPDPFA
jgi:Fic family protein